jgi:hypothetical protein
MLASVSAVWTRIGAFKLRSSMAHYYTDLDEDEGISQTKISQI